MIRGNAGRAVRGLDFNRSPAQAIWGLMGVEHRRLRNADMIHEVACGDGALVLPMRAAGLEVSASDIVDRGCPISFQRDFLHSGFEDFDYSDAVVTNPPFGLAQEFVAAALDRCCLVMMLLRIQFLEASGRNEWLRSTPLDRVYVFVDRLPMMHREGYEGRKLGKGTTCFAWFVWDTNARPAQRCIDWIGAADIEVGRRLCCAP